MDNRKAALSYKIVERSWNLRLEAGLLALVTPAEVAWHRREVTAGREKPLALMKGSAVLGTGLYRVEPGPQGSEMVLIGVTGDGSSMGLVFGLLERFAALKGCAYLRFHTTRPGLVRRAVAAGYAAPEFVMIKRVA